MSRGLFLSWLWRHRISPEAVPPLTFKVPITRYTQEADTAWCERINQASKLDEKWNDDRMRRALWSISGTAFRRDRRQHPRSVRNCIRLVRRAWAAHSVGRGDLARAEFAAAREAFLHSSQTVLVKAAIERHKFTGRKPGSFGPIRKRIAATLKKNPQMKNADLWERIKARPPRGWTAYENSRLGRYFEGPTPEQVTSYSRFCNIASEERRALKGS